MHKTTMNTNTPRAWVGCLACYNSGRLVGDWYDADEAGDLDISQVHQDGGYAGHCDGEELWCFDTENMPGGEMDPLTAADWGERYDELADDSQWPAYLAYVENFGGGDLPEVADFEEAYRGEFSEFVDYIYEMGQETGLMDGWPEIAQRHFDWEGYAEECGQDYLTVDAPGGVFVFWAHN
jgi:antirestriction protein